MITDKFMMSWSLKLSSSSDWCRHICDKKLISTVNLPELHNPKSYGLKPNIIINFIMKCIESPMHKRLMNEREKKFSLESSTSVLVEREKSKNILRMKIVFH